MVIIGQNNDAIDEQYRLGFDGISVYTDINLYGVDEVVDFGNGNTCIKDMLEKHKPKMCVIGLYIREFAEKIRFGYYNKEIEKLSSFFKKYPAIEFIVRIGYEPESCNKTNFKESFKLISSSIRCENVKTCLSYIGVTTFNKCLEYAPVEFSDDIDDNKGVLDVDYIASNVFTSRDTCDGAIALAKEYDIPFMIAETCLSGKDIKHKKSQYFELIEKISKQIDIEHICYIGQDWDNYDMWTSTMYKGTKSKINADMINELRTKTKGNKNG